MQERYPLADNKFTRCYSHKWKYWSHLIAFADIIDIRAQRNDARRDTTDTSTTIWRAIRLSHLHIMLTFSSVLVYNAEAARLLSANSSLRARLCASRNFLEYEAGLLKQITGCGILIIPFTWYPRSFIQARSLARSADQRASERARVRLNGRDRMRWSNKIFTISNKLPRPSSRWALADRGYK